MNGNTIDITVMGQQLTLAVSQDERETVLEAIDLLDEKIRQVRQRNPGIDSNKTLILAALNTVHGLLAAQPAKGLARDNFERRISALNDVCCQVLAQTEV